MGRFADVDQEVLDVINQVREEYFRSLAGSEINILFDQKKRMSGGKLVLGRMKKCNELERHLSKDAVGNGEGYDYIMYLDELAWDMADEDQRVKLVRHELRHCDVDIDAASPYKIKGHDIEDFEEEIRLNQDNPGWANQLAELVALEYAEEAARNRRGN